MALILWQQEASVAIDASLSDDKLWICKELVESGGCRLKIFWLCVCMCIHPK